MLTARPSGNILVIAALAWVAGCRLAPADERAAIFSLSCATTSTQDSSSFYCLRIDSRDGDVRFVDLGSLPEVDGPEREGPAGSYQLVCGATNTELATELRCVRLDLRTGQAWRVNPERIGAVRGDGTVTAPGRPPQTYGGQHPPP